MGKGRGRKAGQKEKKKNKHSTLAPFFTSISMPSAHPSYAALCNGVFPAPSTSLISAFWSFRSVSISPRSRLNTARCSFIAPTVPRPRMEPPPSDFTPTQPYCSGKGPCTRVYHGLRSTILGRKACVWGLAWRLLCCG